MDYSKKERLEAGADIFKALAHPARLALLESLAEGPRCVCDLAHPLGLAPAAASKYLAQLRQAGLIEVERKGPRVEYHLATPCVLELVDCAVTKILSRRRPHAVIKA